MRALLARLKEPSSYAGLAAVAGGVERIAAGEVQMGLAIALAGALAFVRPEGVGKPPQ